MTSTSDAAHAATCSVSSGGECSCGGAAQLAGSDLPDMLRAAAAVGCTITSSDAPAQLARIDRLRPHVIGLERRRGFLAVSLDREADSHAINDVIQLETGCCSFLRIDRERGGDMTRVVFSSDDRQREPALAALARAFDPAAPAAASETTTAPDVRRRDRTPLGVFGVTCLACLIPGILAAGAAGSITAAFGGAAGLTVVLALLLTLGATTALVLRPSRARTCGC